MKKTNRKIIAVPEPTVRRMPKYLNCLRNKQTKDLKTISAPSIARELKLDPTQVTKDIAYTGITGKTRIGYNIQELIEGLEDFLGCNRTNEAFLLGVGNLGKALIGYPGFKDFGVKIVAGFDINPEIIGTKISGVPIYHIDKFIDVSKNLHIGFGILTTPTTAAQGIADLMVESGLRAIWNFSPIQIKVPENIIVQNTSIYSNLAILLNKIHSSE